LGTSIWVRAINRAQHETLFGPLFLPSNDGELQLMNLAFIDFPFYDAQMNKEKAFLKRFYQLSITR
jgi:hypothetical protein